MTKKISYKLVQGPSSNYEVQVFLTKEDLGGYTTRVLLDYQKDVAKPGFRKGHVPLEMIKEMIDPQYIKIGMLEYIIHDAMKQVLDDHKDVEFIGYPYDLDSSQLEKTVVHDGEEKYLVSFKVDVYPTVVEKNKNWETIEMSQMDLTVTQEHVDEVLKTIARQYAEYTDTDAVCEHSVVRVSLQFFDNDGNEVGKRLSYVGEDEFSKFPDLKNAFINQKKGSTIEISYDQSNLPSSMHYLGEEGKKIFKVSCSITDIKDLKVPDVDDTFVAKVFGNEEIKTVSDLRKQVEKTILEHRKQEELVRVVDKWIEEITPSFDISIPQTLLQEEVKGRLERLKKNLGGEKGWERFLANMNESKQRAYFDELRYTAKQSLIKFFVFKTVVEKLGLNVDWSISLDAERKLYEKLVGERVQKDYEKKEQGEKEFTQEKSEKGEKKEGKKKKKKE